MPGDGGRQRGVSDLDRNDGVVELPGRGPLGPHVGAVQGPNRHHVGGNAEGLQHGAHQVGLVFAVPVLLIEYLASQVRLVSAPAPHSRLDFDVIHGLDEPRDGFNLLDLGGCGASQLRGAARHHVVELCLRVLQLSQPARHGRPIGHAAQPGRVARRRKVAYGQPGHQGVYGWAVWLALDKGQIPQLPCVRGPGDRRRHRGVIKGDALGRPAGGQRQQEARDQNGQPGLEFPLELSEDALFLFQGLVAEDAAILGIGFGGQYADPEFVVDVVAVGGDVGDALLAVVDHVSAGGQHPGMELPYLAARCVVETLGNRFLAPLAVQNPHGIAVTGEGPPGLVDGDLLLIQERHGGNLGGVGSLGRAGGVFEPGGRLVGGASPRHQPNGTQRQPDRVSHWTPLAEAVWRRVMVFPSR